MTPILETQRLLIREISLTDVDGFYELDSDPEVHRYLGNKPVKTKEECEAVIKFVQQQYIDNGIGRWAAIEKETGNFIGWTGLKLVKEMTNNHINYYDLGYRLIRKYWGKGYATKSAMASLRYGFDTLKLSQLYACAHVDNVGSNKVLSKIGLTCLSTFDYDGAKHNWYMGENVKEI